MKLNKFSIGFIVGAFALTAQNSWSADLTAYNDANAILTSDYAAVKAKGGAVRDAVETQDTDWQALKVHVCGDHNDVNMFSDQSVVDCFTAFTWSQVNILQAALTGKNANWANYNTYNNANIQLTADYQNNQAKADGPIAGKTQVEDRSWNSFKIDVCGPRNVFPTTDIATLTCYTNFTSAQDGLLQVIADEAGLN